MGTHLHFDCFSGISGDMILGSLVDAGLPVKDLIRSLKDIPIEGYHVQSKKVMRGGIHATKVDVVVHEGFQAPLSLPRIHRILEKSRVPGPVKTTSRAVFDELARAEGIAHGVNPGKVTFHEVGVVDSFVDVVGCLLGCNLLGVHRISASEVNLGSGWLNSAHGPLPVPGPAVAVLAQGIPVYGQGPKRELTTPTGMALLRALTQDFGPLPPIRPTSIGYGAGTADPAEWPNVLRVYLGEFMTGISGAGDQVVQIETNLDDLHPQAYETVMDRLFAGGALDVTLTPVIMKRGRPGIVLTTLAPREKTEAVAGVLLKETTALGVRMWEVNRRVLRRQTYHLSLSGGEVRMKVAEVEPGMTKAAPEYSDCKRIAEQTGRPVREVMEEAIRVFGSQGKSKKLKGKSKKK